MGQLDHNEQKVGFQWPHEQHTVVVHGQEHNEVSHSKLNHMNQRSDELPLDRCPSVWQVTFRSSSLNWPLLDEAILLTAVGGIEYRLA